MVSELNKIVKIPAHSEINLWFEDDVFCQINCWFVLNFIFQNNLENDVYLVRPLPHSSYLYGGLSTTELESVFENKTKVEELEQFASLWRFYAENNIDELVNVALQVQNKFPFVFDAVSAIKASIPSSESRGILIETLIQIKNELQTNEFSLIFREFSKRLPIYGFGDLQVKYLLNQIEEEAL